MNWLRWHHGTTTDPKWRVIARASGRSLPEIVAVWAMLLEYASEQHVRGSVAGFDVEAASAGLDVAESDVRAILDAMEGRVIEAGHLKAWERRQPKREREDHSTERVREHRRRHQPHDSKETPRNATERPDRGDREERERTSTPSVDRCASRPTRAVEYTPDFEAAWQAYPKRAGANPKQPAFKAWRARMREKVKPAEVTAGIERYAAFLKATGKTGTEFVLQAATFFGPGERWRETWQAPPPPVETTRRWSPPDRPQPAPFPVEQPAPPPEQREEIARKARELAAKLKPSGVTMASDLVKPKVPEVLNDEEREARVEANRARQKGLLSERPSGGAAA